MSSRSRRFARRRRPSRSARRPRRVGLRRAGPGQRRRAGRHTRLRPPLGGVPAHDDRRLGRGGRAAARSDGQLGGRPPDDRERPRALPGPDARQQGDRGRVVLREPGARGGVLSRARGRNERAPDRTRLVRRRPLARRAPASAVAARSGARHGRRTWIHAFTDGRDVSPTSSVRDLAELPEDRLATVVGRYYAMDRDQRWERTDRALSALVRDEGATQAAGVAEVQRQYARGVTDEFLEPIVLAGRPRIAPSDQIVFFNFRPDRARQLTERLLASGFELTTMTRYREA